MNQKVVVVAAYIIVIGTALSILVAGYKALS